MNVRVQYLFLLLMVAGCTPDNISFLNPQGPIAAAQRWHFVLESALVMLVVLPVLVLTPLVAWRYRRKNQKARYTPKWDFSMPVEFAIWGIPVAIVAVLVVLLWRSPAALDPYPPLEADKPPLRVQVVGLDWKRLFVYPDQHIAIVGVIAFSADRPLALELTSDSVMQSFFIPALGSQIYAMAGMVTKLHLAAYSPGVFPGENAQFSGTGFHRQKFTAVAMHRDKFAAWVEQVRANGISLDEATYRMLAEKSTPERANEELGTAAMPHGVRYFADVPSGLFATIVDKYRYGRANEVTRDQVRKGAAPLSPVLVTGRETRQ